ncbi:MAG: arsenite methyltransferase [Paludibacter sp.]|nr:arsenite methyltransferase [Paludibacter sp.]
MNKDLKLVVQEKYGEIAQQSLIKGQSSCCGTTSCCGELEFSMIGDDYDGIAGHHPDADMGLGCGLPTQYAAIREGDSVLDLGSGAGNDCFVARAIVGDRGKVTGLDFVEAMITKARLNNQKVGYSNVEFVQGDIESMPFSDNGFDVIVSNCVLNLVPDKVKAFSEIIRVLKPGGHFCVSDVVIKGELPKALKEDAVMYAGCVAGALDINEYLAIIEKQGFKEITIHKQKLISIPEEILVKYLTEEEVLKFNKSETGIFSITVSAKKI